MRKLVLEDVKEAIRNSSITSEILVGCDSQVFYTRDKHTGKKVRMASYAKVVVVHIDGNRGAMVFGDVTKERDYGQLRTRLMAEVGMAVELAQSIIDEVGDRPFQIHLDINTDASEKSNICMREAVGYVRGMFGFDPVLKPDAFIASSCADRLAH